MGSEHLFRPSLVAGLVLLAMFTAGPHARAQNPPDRPKIEVVPNISHSWRVQSVAFSPDGKRMLSGSGDGMLKLWDAATGQLLRGFEGHPDVERLGVWSATFSPDGTKILSGGWDKTLKLWDSATGRLIHTFVGHTKGVHSVAFSPDRTRVLSGSDDSTIRLWDAARGTLLRTFEGHSHGVTSVAFSQDGVLVLSGSWDKTVRTWDAATGALLRTFLHRDLVASAAFSPDGTRVLSGAGNTLSLWEAATGRLIHNFSGHTGTIGSVAYSPDGMRVLSGSWDKTLKLWDAVTGRLIRTLDGNAEPHISVAYSPDGTQILAGSGDTTLKLWDAVTGRLIRTIDGKAEPVRSVAYSPDGTRVLTGSWDGALNLWDAVAGRLIRTLDGNVEPQSGRAGRRRGVWSVAFSPDGTRVLSGSDGMLKLWDGATGRLIQTVEADGTAVAFSPDGTRILSGVQRRGLSVPLKLWDATTAQGVRTFRGHASPIITVAFSPDGTKILSGGWDKTLKLWDSATGRLIHTFSGHSHWVSSAAFSPDGTRALSGSWDSTLKLWDSATGRLIHTFAGHSDRVASVAFSPDGTRALSGSFDRTLKLWDAATKRLTRTLEGHSDWVHRVAFSPDGRRFVSGSDDTTTRLWDTENGAQLAVLVAGRGGTWLALTPKGFFAGARSANDLLGIVRGLNVTTIDQVHQSLYSPDLVREALAGDPDGEVAEAAKVVNLEKVLDSGPAPSVAILSPAGGSQSATDLVTVTAQIEDRGKGVGRIEWRVNGVTAAVAAKPAGGGPAHIVTRQLALEQGDNTVEVVAYNDSNLLASLPTRATVKFTGPADKIKPKLHILAIGINAYADRGWSSPGGKQQIRFEPLGLAVKDAKAFAADMQKAAAGLYDEVRVTLALDQEATRDNLHKLIETLAAQIHPRDSFILFAAAHGDAESGRFYLIPQDYQSGPLGTLARHAIGQDALQDWLANRIKARKAVVLLDTCESGSLIAGHRRSRVDSAASEAGVGRLHEATGRPVLTAAAAGQAAGEGTIAGSRDGHGYFTWAVRDALRHGDANGNDLIELSELAAHVQSVVPKIAAGIVVRAAVADPAGDKQTARFGSRGEDFAVARRLP